jgi:signal transduction histidine kinase
LHRLKTPLLGIRQLSELLPQTEALSGDGQRKVDIIQRTAVEGMNIVDELLAPASSPPLRRAVEDVDLGRLVRAVATRLRATAEYKHQRIHCAIAPECRVRGEGERLREVIENLIGNALKYSPRHAHVSVRVRRSNGTVQLIVADKGPGLSAVDQRRLFRPFSRLPVRPTGGEGSSGLGLYFSKRIVEAHGGRIGVVSAPGRGSTFVVVLPESSFTRGQQEETTKRID